MFDWSTIKYVIAGVANTALGLSVIYLAMLVLHMGGVAANIFGYSAGAALSFLLNRRWVFVHRGSWRRSLALYLAVMATAYAANLITFILMVRLFGTNPFVAQAMAVIPYVTIGYIGSRQIAFR